MFFSFIFNSFPIRSFQSFHSLMGTLMEENSIYFIRYGRRGLSLVSINGFKSWGGEKVLLTSPDSPTKVVCPSGFKPYVTLIIFVVFIESVFGSSAQLLNFGGFLFGECITTKDTRIFRWWKMKQTTTGVGTWDSFNRHSIESILI